MASRRHYAYYIRGSQVAVIEHDYVSGDGQTLGQPALDDIGPSGGLLWKSPVDTITDGIEIEYAYSPRYRINDASDTLAVTAYNESGETGLLALTIASCSFTAGDPIVISGSEKWNGLHTVNTTISGQTTLVLNTKYNGGSVTESFNVLQDVDALNDEADEIDLSEYLCKALVYYVKAKIAEDMMQLDQKEYYMREFRNMLEKEQSAKIWGSRTSVPGPHAIR
jgi:hypothetical protein